MISLEEHNRVVMNSYNMTSKGNGIDCPKCGGELRDDDSEMMRMSNPPQKAIVCDNCHYTGFRNC